MASPRTTVASSLPRSRAFRAGAFWLVVAIVIAGAVTWRVRTIRDAVAEGVHSGFGVTTQSLLVRVVSWADARVAIAETMAALLAPDVARPPGGRDEPLAARFAAAMEMLAQRETFIAGRILGEDARVLARVGDTPSHDREPRAADDTRSPVPLNLPSQGGVAKTVRIATVPCGDGFCIEFHAPMTAGGVNVGSVVLVTTVDDSTFRPLNAAREGVRTARASVLAPIDASGSDSFAVLASLGSPDSPEPPDRIAATRLPAMVRAALAAPPRPIVTDTGPGLHGASVHYAVGRVPELDWIVLREIDSAEVDETVRSIVMVEEPIMVALLLLLAVAGRSRVRAVRSRREKELTRLRADFVASTSHELRTPLAQIRMFAELLQAGTLTKPEEARRALRIIEKEANRLTILVDNVLNFSRLRRRADDAALDRLPPADVAIETAHVIEAFAPLAAERQARIDAMVPPGLHARVDAMALRQVLTNYLENAVKYGPARQTLTIAAQSDQRRVRIWIDDQGPGVPVGERESIWTPFHRGAQAELQGPGGSGIGLSVVRDLALHYGGTVGVEDAPGGGARFFVEFPAASAAGA